jgi:hypothetical protein
MRDRDYSLARPPGTYRMAMLGPSTAMGSGVEQDESFEAVLEQQLNDGRTANGTQPVEILNFGVADYSPFHVLFQLDRKVFAFDPQLAMFVGHASDPQRTSRQFIKMVTRGTLPNDPYLQALAHRTGLRRGIGPNEARRRMRGHEQELLGWVYRQSVERCRARGVSAAFVYMEVVTELDEPWRVPDRQAVLELARNAGFTLLDLTGAYQPYASSDLWIAENDGHPNALGNRLLADRLHALLRQKRDEIGVPLP